MKRRVYEKTSTLMLSNGLMATETKREIHGQVIEFCIDADRAQVKVMVDAYTSITDIDIERIADHVECIRAILGTPHAD